MVVDTEVDLPVVGGHAGITILPVFSQVSGTRTIIAIFSMSHAYVNLIFVQVWKYTVEVP